MNVSSFLANPYSWVGWKSLRSIFQIRTWKPVVAGPSASRSGINHQHCCFQLEQQYWLGEAGEEAVRTEARQSCKIAWCLQHNSN